jgi:hypothetical protein
VPLDLFCDEIRQTLFLRFRIASNLLKILREQHFSLYVLQGKSVAVTQKKQQKKIEIKVMGLNSNQSTHRRGYGGQSDLYIGCRYSVALN